MITAVLPLLLFAAALPKASMIPVSEALEPEAALASFELADGLQIELVASEPLVFSPVAMAFDERGRLFVVEMPGFPLGNPPGEKAADRVALLEDTDGDGRMDKRTVYADDLAYPMGVLPWKDGIIVTCAPDIFLLRDTDGDGRADERRVLFTGFSTKHGSREKSPALRMNDPTLGPDGWIYIASGLSGGTITTPDHPERPALKMTSDVRFHPDTLEIENVDGRSQYGMSFDAAGRRFLTMNRLPVQHVVLSSKWLQRNPNLTFTETVQDCNERTMRSLYRGEQAPGVQLFPISSHFVNVDSHAGSFTAACAVHIWRGGALPEMYRGAAFSCDPTANLVHVDRLVPHGATFAAEPMLEGHEFLASRDDWFRPVFLTTGPDGGLYVTDMYQKIIEHIEYLPEEVQKYADVNAGRDRGRIWRIVAKERPAMPVQPEPIVAKEAWTDVPQSRGRGTAAERWLKERLEAAASPDARTRFLAALVLGDVSDPRATAALAAIVARDMSDRWARAAVLSGVAGREVEVFKALVPHLRDPGQDEQEFLTVLGRGFPSVPAVRSALLDDGTRGNDAEPEERLPIAAALLLGLSEKTGGRLLAESHDPWLDAILRESIRRARDADYPLGQRITLVRLLGRMSWEQAGSALQHLAVGEADESLRSAAVRSLAGFDEPEVVRTLLAAESWSAATPTQRTTILSALLPSDFHLSGLLDAIESGAVPVSAISGVPRRQLLAHKDPSIRQRAENLWGGPPVGRQQALDAAKAALALSANSVHGREVFRNLCASCHRLDQEGYNVGPDLADMRRQAKETILYHIVAPEAEIAPPFVTYVAETKDGRTLSGILTSETPASITLQGPLAHEETVRRSEIERLEALPVSMMPSGLEAAMSQQHLADLLAYLRGEK